MRVLAAVTLIPTFLITLTFSALQPTPAQLAGNWKLSFLIDRQGQLLTLGLLKLEEQGGKLSATLDPAPEAPKITFPGQAVTLAGDMLTIQMELERTPLKLTFNLPKGETQRFPGTLSVGTSMFPVQIEATKDQSAKEYKGEAEVPLPKGGFKEMREYIAKNPREIGILSAAYRLNELAAVEKVAAADLKAALVPVFQAARAHGDWAKNFTFNFAREFAASDQYAALGEELARQGLAELGANATISGQLKFLDLVATSLKKQNKANELATVSARIDALEVKGHDENEKEGLGFDPVKFAGRKGNKAVLVELFTGAQCPPCVAADLAFEGLAKTYAPSEVVLLQYHLHIPGPDPMTTPDTEARAEFYGKEVRGTPSIFFNGKSAAGGGGFRQHAPEKYKEYGEVIKPLLDEESPVKISLAAKRAGDSVDFNVSAVGYKPGDKLKLRVVLVEDWVRYTGSNGLSYHAHVVRAMPGGPGGFALEKDGVKQSGRIELADLRRTADKFLQDVDQFIGGARPLAFRNLRMVAFVQNDDTKEVLNAAEVIVK